MGTQINDTGAGYQIGGNATEKIGLWGATPVVQPSGAAQAAMTENSGAIGGTNDADFSALVLTGTVIDDDSAATNGTAVYIHVDEVSQAGSPIAHLESANAGNANAGFNVGNGGPSGVVKDDDNAATLGVQVYFDEDATNADERFLINNIYGGIDRFIVLEDGKAIRFTHDASASTNGVALYFDDDAANNYERLLFVSPTDANGSYTTDDEFGCSSPTEHVRELATSVNTIRSALVATGIMKGSA